MSFSASGHRACPRSSSVDSTIWLSSQTNYFGDDPVRSKRYPKAKLAQLYHLRWQATEVNFKHLKTTLNMEMIWAKSPQMVRKKSGCIYWHNLLRNLMWTSAELAQVPPMRISCKALGNC